MSAESRNELICNSLLDCNNAYKYVAKLEAQFCDLPSIKVFPCDIGQIVIKLVVNDAHAIVDKKEKTGEMGRINIHTSCENKMIVIAISDTGSGVSGNIRQRIFDLFFTTKKLGQV